MSSPRKLHLLAKSLAAAGLLVPAALFAASPATTPPATGASAAAPAHKSSEIVGTVVSYTSASGALIVHGADNKDVTVIVDKATVVTLDGKPASPAVLAARQHVSVLTKQDAGKTMATAVAVTGQHS